jgi:drug/metabolite transporter (DMT)-like permease
MQKNQRALFEVILMAALFAPSFLFIKLAVQHIEPITVIVIRLALAGLLLWSIAFYKKLSFPRDLKTWLHCAIFGFFANGFPFVCYSFSLTLIPTSLSALINGMTPILTVFLAHIMFVEERLTLNRLLGVILGLCGFIVLFLPTLLKSDQNFSLLGMSLCFVGAASYAIAIIYAKKYVQHVPFFVAPSIQLLSSLIYLLPLAFIFETPLEAFSAPSSAWFEVAGVSLFGTALAFILYHRIVLYYGATALAMAPFLLPVFGAILGVLFLGEKLDSNFVASASLILSGLAVINGILPIPLLRRRSNV